MLIALYFFIVNVVVLRIGVILKELGEPIMICVIMLVGIILMFGAVGLPISHNLGATITTRIFKSIGFIVKKLFNAIIWIIQSIPKLLSKVFKTSKQSFISMGLKVWICNLISTIITILTLAIII